MKNPAGTLYLSLSLLGAALPWAFFLDFLGTGGKATGFVPALFANGAAGGFTVDLLISSVTFWVFMFADSRRRGVSAPWLYVAVNLAIGLSCALPLYLWRRTRAGEGPSRLATSATVALLAVVLAPALALAEAPVATDPEAVVARFYDAYRAADVDAMLEVYAPDATFIDVAQRHDVQGSTALRAFLQRLVSLHLAMGVDVERQVVAGSTVVVELAYAGTLSGAALHQATGREGCTDTPYRIPLTTWFDVSGGRIVRQKDFVDLETLEEVKARAGGSGN